MGILDKITGKRSSADIERERLTVINQAEQLSIRVADGEASLNADALDADVATLSRCQAELAALKLKRQALSAKAEALSVERDAAADREAEEAKAERAKAERQQHADAIKRMPNAVAAVELAHATLVAALGELCRLDPYAGALGATLVRPGIFIPAGFSSSAMTWDAVTKEATRVRKARMDGEALSLSVWHDDHSRNVAAARAWGDL
jgi:multidrug resistance efflux pump